MKRGRWIDPMSVLGKSTTSQTSQSKEVNNVKYRTVTIKNASLKKAKLLNYIKAKTTPFVWEDYKENSMKVEEYAKYHQRF